MAIIESIHKVYKRIDGRLQIVGYEKSVWGTSGIARLAIDEDEYHSIETDLASCIRSSGPTVVTFDADKVRKLGK